MVWYVPPTWKYPCSAMASVSPEEDEVVEVAQPDSKTNAHSHTNGKDIVLQTFMICLLFFFLFSKTNPPANRKPTDRAIIGKDRFETCSRIKGQTDLVTRGSRSNG